MRKLRISVMIQDFREDGPHSGDRVFESHIDMPAETFNKPLWDLLEQFFIPTARHTIQNFNDCPHQEEIDAQVRAILNERV